MTTTPFTTDERRLYLGTLRRMRQGLLNSDEPIDLEDIAILDKLIAENEARLQAN